MSSDNSDEIEIKQLTFIYKDLKTNEKQLVFHYYVDNFSEYDIHNAKIILFAGKTGSGKTTAINAFVNIVKGVKLGDHIRYNLIQEETKEKGQAESQTDGIHIYYLKDYQNKPLIILDSQGYGDTRGHNKDLDINKAFEFVFSNIINHIDIVLLTVNSTDPRLGPTSKYIYSAVTSLFADDISDNFIVLATFANKSNMKNPDIISGIIKDEDTSFLNVQNKKNKKWWYSLDSKTIFTNDEDKITKHSFKQLKNFYEETVKNSEPKDIKKSAEILTERNRLIGEADILKRDCNLIIEQQSKLSNEESDLETTKKECEFSKKEREGLYKIIRENRGKKEEIDKGIKSSNEEHEKKIKEMKEKKRDNSHYELVDTSNINTHCDSDCHSNCHLNCNCYKAYESCKKYEWKGWQTKTNKCKVCGHMKKYHTKENKKWEYKVEYISYYTDEEIQKEIDIHKRDIERIQKMFGGGNVNNEDVLKDLEKNSEYIQDREKKIQNAQIKIEDIKKEINKTQKELLLKVLELQKINEKIQKFALNKNHIKTENEYIKNLMDQQNHMNKDDYVKKLEDIQKLNELFIKMQNIKIEELENCSDDELNKKIEYFLKNVDSK